MTPAFPFTPAKQAEQILRAMGDTPRARVLASVVLCPDRGNVLPVSRQAECGCAELTECRAGRGSTPGRVSLKNCIECREMADVKTSQHA